MTSPTMIKCGWKVISAITQGCITRKKSILITLPRSKIIGSIVSGVSTAKCRPGPITESD